MRKKRFEALLLSLVLALSPLSTMQVQAKNVSDDTKVKTVQNTGYIESDLDKNVPVRRADVATYAMLPSAYSTDIDACRREYPAVRDQNPYGTCWAFSSLGLAEFDLISDGIAKKDIDLSELQLIYFTYNFVTDPLGGTKGDTAEYNSAEAKGSFLNFVGNYEMAARRMSQWVGAVKEADVPYTDAEKVEQSGLKDSYAYSRDVAHLENAYCMSLKEDTDGVKAQIMDHGAVGVMYDHLDKAMAKNQKGEYTYYDAEAGGNGHAAMIVGWDDDYSRDNFAGYAKPAQNGAWLIRNSWGSYCDYFWMSYETVSLGEAAWAFDFDTTDAYDNNYQLDGGLNAYPTEFDTLANVFTVQDAKAGVEAEELRAVNVSMMHNANVSYTISVYTDLKDPKDPTSGTKQEKATTTGETSYAGIYTIPLENAVELQPGTTFSVVVQTDTNAVECELEMSIENGGQVIWSCDVSKGNEKTFYQYHNKFYAYPYGNACIKALTSEVKNPAYKTGIYTENGEDVYYVDGTRRHDTGLVEVDGVRYYMNDGVVQKEETVVMQEDGTWVYINEDGVADDSYCGFVSYGGSWWEIRNGVIDFSVNSVDEGIVNGEYGWWNVVNGRVDMGNTVAQNAGGWWCIRNGKVDFSYTGVAQNAGGWWRIENGMVNFAYNGVVNSEYGWWFIRNGSIDFTYTGLAQNEYGWWRIVNGTIDFGCNSVVDSEYGWWYVRNGQVDFGYTGVAQNEYGWWRIENGALNFGFTGLAQNEYGWWYIRSGMLDFSYTGYVNWYGTAYRVQNGQVIF